MDVMDVTKVVGFYGCYEKIVTKKYKVHSLSIEKQYKNPKKS